MVRALFPGTFDPIHYGHIDIAERAARLFDEVVMAVYDKPLKSLMFSPDERMSLVSEAFKENPKIKVTGYSGLRSEEHTSELQSPCNLVCRLLLEKKNIQAPPS